jgi:hypothetical protein
LFEEGFQFRLSSSKKLQYKYPKSKQGKKLKFEFGFQSGWWIWDKRVIGLMNTLAGKQIEACLRIGEQIDNEWQSIYL